MGSGGERSYVGGLSTNLEVASADILMQCCRGVAKTVFLGNMRRGGWRVRAGPGWMRV
jgi:hypothetical protein